MRNEVLDAVLDELRLAGVKGTVGGNGRHQKIWWEGAGGQPRIYVAPSTPSDQRAPANARSEVRRILRSDGMISGEEQRPAAKEPSRIEKLERRIARIEQILAQQKERDCA